MPLEKRGDLLPRYIRFDDIGLRAVLSQMHDGIERPIADASRSLNKPERNYCTTRKELLAVVFSLKQ